jgi:sulfite exporter TauE/SafE
MSTALALTGLLMGVAGAPHCAAMCGAACGGLSAGGGARARWLFQGGRLAGYTAAGAVAATAVQSLGWFAQHAAAARPLWTVFHLAVLAWGLTLLVLARQPAVVEGFGRAAWSRIRPLAGQGRGVFAVGLAWTFLPCGLLWSGLLVASLSGGPVDGAATMALFAIGSSPGLLLAPWLFERLRRWRSPSRREWGTRAAGLLVALAAGVALWMDLAHRIAEWCA